MKPTNNSNGTPLRFALIGCGFWARHQLAAWQELEGAQCIAVCDRVRSKAEKFATDFKIASVYDDAEALLKNEKLDFVDIATGVDTHSQLVQLVAEHQLPVICQKPLATSYGEAEDMVDACRHANVPLLVHENWRWQRPIREIKAKLDQGSIGTPYRARIEMLTGCFSIFENQPSLRDLEQLILADLGTHILDTARFLFDEPQSLYCLTHSIHTEILGEDVATVVMNMNDGRTIVTCNMAYAGNSLEHECFPQTMIFIEAEKGTLELKPDYWIHETTVDKTRKQRCAPHLYSWVDPAYAVALSSIVDCHADLLRGLSNRNYQPETTGEDNLKTLKLVFDAYESAKENTVLQPTVPTQRIHLPHSKPEFQTTSTFSRGVKL